MSLVSLLQSPVIYRFCINLDILCIIRCIIKSRCRPYTTDIHRDMTTQAPPKKFSTGWLSELDGRTAIAQEMRERFRAFTDDLGGAETLSYAKRSLVERALWLEFWLAQQEQALAGGADFDVGKWVQAANGLQGILSKLGLDRQAKDLPSLNEYLARKAST